MCWCQCFSNLMESNLRDLKDPLFYRGAMAEALGTLFLVFVGCGSCIGHTWEGNKPSQVQTSLCFGLGVATMVWCIGHVSGGHINPAVTVGMLVARKISIIRAIVFVVAQCVGALAGAGILYVVTPHHLHESLGATTIDGALSVVQGFLIELMITFVLVFTVFASCDANREDLNGSAPLTIGLSVTLCHLFAIKYTGSSMNPARTFGPAVIKGIWPQHYVYWAGPLLGGIIAALLYELVFASDASVDKAKQFCLSRRSSDVSLRPTEDESSLPEEKVKMTSHEEKAKVTSHDEKAKVTSHDEKAARRASHDEKAARRASHGGGEKAKTKDAGKRV